MPTFIADGFACHPIKVIILADDIEDARRKAVSGRIVSAEYVTDEFPRKPTEGPKNLSYLVTVRSVREE